MSAPPVAYRAASLALALPLAGYTVLRALRDGGAEYLCERYGFTRARPAQPVWLHCASVGEVTATAPLLRELAAHDIGPLLLSTATPTGRRRALELAPAGVSHAYLPIDRPGPVRRFLRPTGPRVALILETELWPHLFCALERGDIPILLVNGRLSPRTLEAPAWWRHTAAWCIARTRRVLARSERDREHFLALGAAEDRVETVGNLKLAAPPPGDVEAVSLPRPFVLAASTHGDEELQLARAWHAGGSRDHLLAIAPRHPERGSRIADALTRDGFRVARRSLGEMPRGSECIYLADTLGELTQLIAGAEAVIMGGSFIDRGGQNVLEPARVGRPIVTGPHMHNCPDETERLEAAGALLRTNDADAAVREVAALLADAERRARMGDRGRQLLAAEADMAARYRQAIVAAVPALGAPRG